MEMTGDKGAVDPVVQLEEWRSVCLWACCDFFLFKERIKKGNAKKQNQKYNNHPKVNNSEELLSEQRFWSPD